MFNMIQIVNAVVAAGVFVTVHCNVTGTVYKKQENMRHASVLQVVTAKSALSCGSLCNLKDWCEVFNFHPMDRLCELVNLTPGEEDQAVVEVGWDMYYATICLPGWWGFEKSCYYLDNTVRLHQDAQRICSNLRSGAHLVDITSGEEQAFVCNYIKEQNTSVSVWTGAYLDESATEFFWSDDTPFGYTNWTSDEPNSVIGQHCVLLLFSWECRWFDDACSVYRVSVCEYEIA